MLLFGRHSFVNAFGDGSWCHAEAHRTQRDPSYEEGTVVHDVRRQPAGCCSGLRGERAMTQYNNLLGKFHPNEIPHGVPQVGGPAFDAHGNRFANELGGTA